MTTVAVKHSPAIPAAAVLPATARPHRHNFTALAPSFGASALLNTTGHSPVSAITSLFPELIFSQKEQEESKNICSPTVAHLAAAHESINSAECHDDDDNALKYYTMMGLNDGEVVHMNIDGGGTAKKRNNDDDEGQRALTAFASLASDYKRRNKDVAATMEESPDSSSSLLRYALLQ